MQTIKRDLQKYNNITLPSATTIIATSGHLASDLSKIDLIAANYHLSNSSDLKSGIGDKVPISVITGPPQPQPQPLPVPAPSSSSLSNNLFNSINNSNSNINNNNNSHVINNNSIGNKRLKTDDWSSMSPRSSMANTSATSANMLPHTPSPGATSQSYTVVSNDFSSPLSNASYDPYSPNIKNGEFFETFFFFSKNRNNQESNVELRIATPKFRNPNLNILSRGLHRVPETKKTRLDSNSKSGRVRI